MPGRLTLGLYNCYDAKQWHDIMRITLARAAPVAAAFDCHLATFGFPFAQARPRGAKQHATGLDTPADVAAFVAASTSIGEGGEHLVALAESRRFSLRDFDEIDGARFGRLVATTPSPAPGRATTPRDVAAELAAGRDQLLVIGLGPRGLPNGVLDAAPVHLELTGKSIPFETATALGAIPAMVRAHQEHLGGLG